MTGFYGVKKINKVDFFKFLDDSSINFVEKFTVKLCISSLKGEYFISVKPNHGFRVLYLNYLACYINYPCKASCPCRLLFVFTNFNNNGK